MQQMLKCRARRDDEIAVGPVTIPARLTSHHSSQDRLIQEVQHAANFATNSRERPTPPDIFFNGERSFFFWWLDFVQLEFLEDNLSWMLRKVFILASPTLASF